MTKNKVLMCVGGVLCVFWPYLIEYSDPIIDLFKNQNMYARANQSGYGLFVVGILLFVYGMCLTLKKDNNDEKVN